MSKVTLISSVTCVKCHFIKNPLKARAEKNGCEFIEKDVSTATKEEIGEVMSPSLFQLQLPISAHAIPTSSTSS